MYTMCNGTYVCVDKSARTRERSSGNPPIIFNFTVQVTRIIFIVVRYRRYTAGAYSSLTVNRVRYTKDGLFLQSICVRVIANHI